MIAFVDLMEAEGRSLRRAVVRVGFVLVIILLALSLTATGVLLCLWAGYEFLLPLLGQALSALIMGICAMAVAGVCLWIAKRLTD